MIVYISIGNSDDKLLQGEWAKFISEIREKVKPLAIAAHGEWFSAPDAPWQNACWCLEFPEDEVVLYGAQKALSGLCRKYRQDSIAWAEVAATEFLEPLKSISSDI